MKPFQSPAPHISRADVPLSTLQSDLRRLIAKQRADVAADRLKQLLSPSAEGTTNQQPGRAV